MEFPDLRLIASKRKALGSTQKALASKAGISQSLLTKIERGLVNPSYGVAVAVFTALEQSSPKESVALEVMNKKVIHARPNDTVGRLATLSKKYGISQFPVVDNGIIIGSVSTSDMIWVHSYDRISKIMKEPFPIIDKSTSLSTIKSLLKASKAVLVGSHGRIAGIITAEDLL